LLSAGHMHNGGAGQINTLGSSYGRDDYGYERTALSLKSSGGGHG
jgi:hypothetical protein